MIELLITIPERKERIRKQNEPEVETHNKNLNLESLQDIKRKEILKK